MLVSKKAKPVKVCQYTGQNLPEVKRFLTTYTKGDLVFSSSNGSILIRKALKTLRVQPLSWILIDTKRDNEFWILRDSVFQQDYYRESPTNRTYLRYPHQLEALQIKDFSLETIQTIYSFLGISVSKEFIKETAEEVQGMAYMDVVGFGRLHEADYLLKSATRDPFVVGSSLFHDLYQET